MPCRGVRGATTADENSEAAILEATRQMIEAIVAANGVAVADVASAVFSTTPDLSATFPARAARDLGWHDVALLDTIEMDAAGGVPRCIRVLIHWNTSRGQDEIVHVYLKAARQLRPDRTRR